MGQETVTISKEEYEELLSLKETLEILGDKEVMNSIKTSLKQIEEVKEIPLSEL